MDCKSSVHSSGNPLTGGREHRTLMSVQNGDRTDAAANDRHRCRHSTYGAALRL